MNQKAFRNYKALIKELKQGANKSINIINGIKHKFGLKAI